MKSQARNWNWFSEVMLKKAIKSLALQTLPLEFTKDGKRKRNYEINLLANPKWLKTQYAKIKES